MNTGRHAAWLTHVVAGVLCLVGLVSGSQAGVFSRTRYVGIEHHSHSVYLYDEAFQKLPDHPEIPGRSLESFPEGQPLWMLGFKVDVVRRQDDGTIRVMSHDPAYFELVHHLVLAYRSPTRPTVPACANTLFAVGSELTDVWLPAGYAYKMDGGAWFPLSGHWKHSTDLHLHQGLYVRLTVFFDDASSYRDVQVMWIGSGSETTPCRQAFAMPPGPSDRQSLPWVAPEDLRLVFVAPHTHDHVESLELQVNGQPLRRFTPASAAIPVTHDDVGEGETSLHVHEGHLPSHGLSVWAPGVYGPIVQKGDALTVYSTSQNPHERSIDNMALFVIAWEAVPAQ